MKTREPASPLTDLYAWTYEHVLFPTWQRVAHGRAISSQLASLEATQWMTAESIEHLQMGAFRELAAHAVANVPYYREAFAQAGVRPEDLRTRADLAALPLLTRDIVRERYQDLRDPTQRGDNVRKSTSGTSGAPLHFEYSNESETWRQATRLRGYAWAGYRLGLPALHYWAELSPPRGLSRAKVGLDRALRRDTYVDALRHDEPGILAAVDVIRRLQPRVIIAYTQAAVVLARAIHDRGLRDWDDIPVICGAEAVLPNDRATLSRAFGAGIFETYGSRETMLIAAECDEHDGMHLSEENLIVEIIRDGRPARSGEQGEVVITDLHNRGFPFIRYANGDLATLDARERCPCGRGLRRMLRVDGRVSDTLHDSRGRPIPGMLFNALFCRNDDVVSQFQVVQRPSAEVLLRVVPGSGWSEQKLAAILEQVQVYLRGLPLVVERCDDIPAGDSGKRRPVVVEHAARRA